ncbi:MAG: hypothetical protein HYZ48_00785, partial [Chlamydiales bacterium]|nr:hypothetical protein [Chlamydiales bacterium]
SWNNSSFTKKIFSKSATSIQVPSEAPPNVLSRVSQPIAKHSTRILTGLFIGTAAISLVAGAPIAAPLIVGSLAIGTGLGASELGRHIDERIESSSMNEDLITLFPQANGGIELNNTQARNVRQIAENVELASSIVSTGAGIAGGFVNLEGVSNTLNTINNLISASAAGNDILTAAPRVARTTINNALSTTP